MAARFIINTTAQMIVLAGLATAAAFISRGFYTEPLPWTYEWSRHVVNSAQEKGMRTVTVGEARQIADSFSHVILDARKEADYLAGHLPGAMPLPVSDLDRHLAGILSMLTPDHPVLVYCSGQDCDESLKLGEILIEAGYTNIALFAGGIIEWQQAGHPVER